MDIHVRNYSTLVPSASVRWCSDHSMQQQVLLLMGDGFPDGDFPDDDFPDDDFPDDGFPDDCFPDDCSSISR